MLEQEWLVVLLLGGVFILLGFAALLWGRGEEKSYYDAISSRPDAREFLNHWPPRAEPGALKTGGWIAIGIGFLLLIIGGILYLAV